MYSEKSDFFAGLEKNMPEIFSRQEASKMIGNILSSATLNNLDSKKLGPKNLKQIGKKVCYEKHSFIDWLKSYHNFTAHIKGKSNNKTNFETVKSAKNNYASGVYNLQQVLFPDQ